MQVRTADRTRRISGRTMGIIVLIAVAAGILLVFVSFYLLSAPSDTAVMSGSLFVSSAGAATQQSQQSATYNVTLKVTHGVGTMNITLVQGTEDLIQSHLHGVNAASISGAAMTMLLDGKQVELVWTQNDTVWNHAYDNHYIASWGPVAPQGEVRGSISPSVFQGLPPSYYVELRLSVVTEQPPPPPF